MLLKQRVNQNAQSVIRSILYLLIDSFAINGRNVPPIFKCISLRIIIETDYILDANFDEEVVQVLLRLVNLFKRYEVSMLYLYYLCNIVYYLEC